MRTPENTRWSCHSCTACCRGFQFGPVEKEVIENLKKQSPGEWWPAASKGEWYEERSTPNGDSVAYLKVVDGHCIFLRDDGLCAVHAKLGEDAKPGFCREFPHHIIEEEDDYVGVIRAECEGWHKSYTSGQPIELNLDKVRALPRVVPRRTFKPTEVMLFPSTAISLAHWQHLEGEFSRCLTEENRGIEGDLIQLRHIIRTLAKLPNQPGDRDVFCETAIQILSPLHMMLTHILESPHADRHQVQFTRTSRDRIERTIHALQQPLRSGRTSSMDEYFNLVLRSDILGKRFISAGSVTAGFGAFALGTLIARSNSPSTQLSEAATHYAGWLRFSAIPAVQQQLISNRMRLHNLFFQLTPND